MEPNLDAFYIPPSETYTAPKRTSGITTSVESSYRIVRPSTSTQAPVEFVRMSDVEHQQLAQSVSELYANRQYLKKTLAKNSGEYGSKLGRYSTFGEFLQGIHEKLQQPHPYVRGRMGSDLTVKQLITFNKLLTAQGVTNIVIPEVDE